MPTVQHKSALILLLAIIHGIFSQQVSKKLFCGTLLLWGKCPLQDGIEILLSFFLYFNKMKNARSEN